MFQGSNDGWISTYYFRQAIVTRANVASWDTRFGMKGKQEMEQAMELWRVSVKSGYNSLRILNLHNADTDEA